MHNFMVYGNFATVPRRMGTIPAMLMPTMTSFLLVLNLRLTMPVAENDKMVFYKLYNVGIADAGIAWGRIQGEVGVLHVL